MTTKTDAAEFGVHVRQGGWRLGLLVARNVAHVSRGGDRRSKRRHALNGKISATEFAALSDTTHDRVLRYLRAWDAAADDGHVPHSRNLAPASKVPLDDMPDWKQFYPPANGRDSHERNPLLRQTATDAGISPSRVAHIVSDKAALKAAIRADAATAQTAMKALDERYDEAPKSVAGRLNDPDKPIELVYEFRRLHRSIDTIVRLVIEGRAIVSATEQDAVLREVGWLRTALGYIEDGVRGDSLDTALAEFMEANS